MDYQRGKLFAKKLMSSIPKERLAELTQQRTKSLILDFLRNPSNFQRLLERCTVGISSQTAWNDDSNEVAPDTLQRANELLLYTSPESIENKFPFLKKVPERVPNVLQPWKVEETSRFGHERAFWSRQREKVRVEVTSKVAPYS